ncbi:hypothetical protein RSOLAG22IIIB_05728 [Rhizoctonia solani]|uniref:Uncharacterized protein n=1 Tax=Rhizoctonia solani TaxID=456999 RepID=A0A0K6G873_9AGAM|nr:hypothetical protein RSOLAG22IIIB_05728 [Rhizoctonia solani]
MISIRVSRTGESILIPPQLPDYLLAVHHLKPIVGKPVDEEVKAIHAVIRALNAVAHLPTFYNPELSMQLSQHLFAAQMAIHQASFSKSLLPGAKSVYTPPILPSHVPITLNQVIGTPSDEELESTHNALRALDSLAIHPHLFDANLSMDLSQHLFNLQFARYTHESSEGHFVSDAAPEDALHTEPQQSQEPRSSTESREAPGLQEGQNVAPVSGADRAPQVTLELAQLGKPIEGIRDILESMNRVLKLIKRDQSTIGCVKDYYHVYKNPLNQQGKAASECGLPRLRYGYYSDSAQYSLWLTHDQVAGYLKFFGIGGDLIQDGDEPHLIGGKEGDATKLLMNYIDAQ